jgi:tripartite-type tricarboxylate transporter receptor subunit TctC
MPPTMKTPIVLALALAAPLAQAQSWPAKPIRNVLTYAGGAEPIARLIAQKLNESLGQPVLIEAQTGANGSVGAGIVARAAPDGYTILGSTGATQIIRGFLVKDVPYDPFRDFTPITHTFDAASVIIAHPGGPSSMKEMIEAAKQSPGKVSYGTTGTGSAYHLSGELIQLLSGAKLLHVPYKSSPQSMQDLIAGRIETAFSVYATSRAFVDGGKAKYVATLNDRRIPALPNVPTVAEALPGFQSPPLWGGYFGPAGLPQPMVQRLHGEISRAIASPDVRGVMEKAGLNPAGGGPDHLAAMMKSDVERLARIAKAAGIVPE